MGNCLKLTFAATSNIKPKLKHRGHRERRGKQLLTDLVTFCGKMIWAGKNSIDELAGRLPNLSSG